MNDRFFSSDSEQVFYGLAYGKHDAGCVRKLRLNFPRGLNGTLVYGQCLQTRECTHRCGVPRPR